MKTFLSTFLSITAVLILSLANAQAAVITDDFSDLNDTANPAWTHLSGFVTLPSNPPNTGHVWDASTGQYHLSVPSNGYQGKYGFIGSQTGPVSTDVTASTDFVQTETGNIFGVAARIHGTDGAFNSAGRTQAYLYGYEPLARSGLAEVTMFNFGGSPFDPFHDLGDPAGVEGVDWIRKVTLDFVNHDYNFSITAVGSTITGVITEVGGGIVAYQTNIDSSHTSGYSGVLSASVLPTAVTDFTIDNFRTVDIPEPATALLAAFGAAAMLLSRRRTAS